MNKTQKYVIVKRYGHEVPIIFHELISHHEIVGEMEVISAGFIRLRFWGQNLIEFSVFGRSETLNKSSRDGDDIIIRKLFNIN